ncbi:MAG: aldo/keto reductase [Cyclobacteriaceae bacterium]|nr:aldo/keto reductase [Cyclobacteriaceae bacterium]
MSNDYTRRKFIKTLMTGVAMGPVVLNYQRQSPGGIPTRPLGNTGEYISILGYGGWDTAVPDEKVSIKMIHEAIEAGVTFFDNAWEYNDGRSEEIVGKALSVNGLRKRVFVMTKVCARDYEGAKRHIEDSLRRLKTGHIDLLQFHSVQYEGDPQRIFDPESGSMKAVLEAKKEGKVRFIGFSGHMYPEMHLEMIDLFNWDAVQLPLNILDAHYNSFQKKVLPVLNRKKIGALGMKSLAGQNARLSRELNVPVKLCRKYAMSLPVSTLICGVQTPEELRSDLEIARDFKPLDEDEINELLETSREPSRDGQIEQYKNPHSGFGCSYHSRVLREEK